jgi:ATPase family associated with various cellular activities (AAA)
VARKVAEFYYELGILSTKEYVECSASDLIAQYVGQSGPKTREALTKALGKVLFVDEAYRLYDGPFGKEAVDELVDSVTKPQFKGKVVVILAGYIDDIDRLLRVNLGLASRFPGELTFENMKPTACLELLERELSKIGVLLSPHCHDGENPMHAQLVQLLEQLAKLPSWGNGRDVVTISKALISTIFERADESTAPLIVTGEDVLAELKLTLSTQKARNCVRPMSDNITLPQTTEQAPSGHPVRPSPASATVTKSEPKECEGEKPEGIPVPTDVERDAGLSDDIWRQLQADKAAQEAAARLYDQETHEHEKTISNLEGASNESAGDVARLEKLQHDADAEVVNELKRKHEEERLRLLGIRQKKLELEAKLKQMREEEDARKKMEAQIQKKLRTIGVCPVGFRWIKQVGGYRCAGGSHFVTDAQLDL